jgi:hypothetical protein
VTQQPPVDVATTEHVETAALDEQVRVLRDAVAACRLAGYGLPELGGEECWVDPAGAVVLAGVALGPPPGG